MQGDSRYIPNITKSDKDDDLVSRPVLQEQFRRIWEMLAYLEGRLGEVTIRDGINILGGIKHDGATQATKVFNNVSLVIADSTETNLTFNSVIYDPAGMHSTANLEVLTLPDTGVYILGAFVSWAPSAAGERYLFIKSGNTYLTAQTSPATAALSCNLSATVLHNGTAGEKVYVAAFQDSGGPLNIQVIGNLVWPTFWAARIA